jgi:hypothetical protein
LLGLFSIGLCVVVGGWLAGWKLQLGTVGGWVGGIGSAAAAVVAVVTLQELLRTRREERDERRARSLLRAARVHVQIEPVQTDVGPNNPMGWSVSVANASDRPIYRVHVGRVLTAVRSGREPATVTMRYLDHANGGRQVATDVHMSVSLAAGESLTWVYVSNETIVNQTYPFTPVTFADEEGNQFRSVPADLSLSGRTVSRWVHADALTPSGDWQRQTDRITPSATLIHVAGPFPRSVYIADNQGD